MCPLRAVNSFLAAEEKNVTKLKEGQTQLTEEYKKYAIDTTRLEQLVIQVDKLRNEFKTLLDESWYTLVDFEMDLHERIDEANVAFEHTIQDMLYEFVENAQLYFVEITEAEAEFSDRLHEFISNFLGRQSIESVLHPELKKVFIIL